MNKIVFYLTQNFFTWRQKKWLNFNFGFMVTGILISVAVLTCAMSIFDGYQKALRHLFSSISPQITIYSTNVDLSTNPKVAQHSPIGYAGGLLSSTKNSKSTLIQGIDSDNTPFTYQEFISEGKGQLDSAYQVVLGKPLAEDLQVTIGDRITLNSSFVPKFTPMGIRYGEKVCRVVGIYSSGFSQHDKTVAFIRLADFEKTFSPEQASYCTGVRLKDPTQLRQVMQELRQELQPAVPWDRHNQKFFAFLQFQKFMLFLILSLLVVVAGFGVVNNVLVFVHSSQVEIGIFKSIGMTHQAIKRTFFLRIFIVAILGIIAGQALGYGFGYLLSKQTLYLLDQSVYLISHIQTSFDWRSFLLVFGVSSSIIYGAVWGPLRKIKKMEIREILK